MKYRIFHSYWGWYELQQSLFGRKWRQVKENGFGVAPDNAEYCRCVMRRKLGKRYSASRVPIVHDEVYQ